MYFDQHWSWVFFHTVRWHEHICKYAVLCECFTVFSLVNVYLTCEPVHRKHSCVGMGSCKHMAPSYAPQCIHYDNPPSELQTAETPLSELGLLRRRLLRAHPEEPQVFDWHLMVIWVRNASHIQFSQVEQGSSQCVTLNYYAEVLWYVVLLVWIVTISGGKWKNTGTSKMSKFWCTFTLLKILWSRLFT